MKDREYGPTLYDCPFVPLHDEKQKANAQRSSGGKSTKRAKEHPPVWDADRALQGLRRILKEVYGE